jgi:hypothetical protein
VTIARPLLGVLAAAAAAVVWAGPAGAAASITADRTQISTAIGHKFLLRTTISNDGSASAGNLIAHLNVLSLQDGVYVDPEDWSSHRTRYLPQIPPGGGVTITWQLQAVNSGSFGVYVAVLPASGAAQPPVVGPTVRVDVAHRHTLDSGGILPLALGIPGALAVATLGLRLRRRRRGSPG